MHGSEPDRRVAARVAESPPRRVNFMREAERMNVQGKDEKTGIMKTGISTEN